MSSWEVEMLALQVIARYIIFGVHPRKRREGIASLAIACAPIRVADPSAGIRQFQASHSTLGSLTPHAVAPRLPLTYPTKRETKIFSPHLFCE